MCFRKVCLAHTDSGGRYRAEVVQLTLAGKKALEDNLEYLKNVRRAEITEEIAVARSFGDLSENAEYDAAKDAQALNVLEIMELVAMLKYVVDYLAENYQKELKICEAKLPKITTIPIVTFFEALDILG